MTPTDAASESERVRRRLAGLPQPEYDPALPITAYREDIVAAIREHPVLIVAGETGSGKTTQLPKLCLEAGRGVRGLVGCTQPRRIAARAMASRVAEELGTELGDLVGFQVRFRERFSPDGYIKFMTDGILLAEAVGDPGLTAYDTLIIDEAHERSLNIDFLLGYLKRLLPRRSNLKVIITSATIDTEKFARHFDDAPVIEVSGRGYPVDVIYQPLEDTDSGEPGGRGLYRAIEEAVNTLSRIDHTGDTLVFLSGEREIHEARDYLARRNWRHTEIMPLYARLSAPEQQRVFHPGAKRRIILATNVAETSLTVPRIRFVIDSGFARISRYAHRSRIQRLPIEPVSQASADQRAGRCGRLGPGTCIRLYSEEDFASRPEFTEPEILRTSLASVILRMLTMGLGAVEEFPFVDPPAPRMINDAYHLLFELQAVDEGRDVTATGRKLARWPLDVRLARMVLEGSRRGCLEDLLVLAAALSIQDPRERPLDAQEAADEAHDRFSDEKSDFAAMLSLWRYLRRARHRQSGNRFRKRCRAEFLSWQRVLEWFDLYQQLRDQAREERLPLKGRHGDFEAVHRAVLAGLLSQIGQRRPEERSYVGPRNRTYHIFPGSGLFGGTPQWIMSAEIVETTRPYARMNARIQPEWVEEQGAHLLKHTVQDPHWSRRRGRVMAWEQVSLYGLVLVERRPVGYAAVDPSEAREIFIREALVRGEFDFVAGFLEHNRRVREEVERMEHKRRQRDVLVDEHALFEFFDARIPADVNSSRSFSRWLETLDDKSLRGLRLSHDVLLREDAGKAPSEQYPDALEAGGQRLELSYLFEPGSPADGVTVKVPLELLNTLDPHRLEWLVPGLLRERLVELMRTLPKPLRRALTPLPRFADAAMERLPETGGGSLLERLAHELREMTGADIGPGDFDEDRLLSHLRFRIVVLDDSGEAIAESRDLEALQERFGREARRRFMDRQGGAYNRDGLTRWDFGDLPETLTTDSGARAWPALVDREETVSLRLFETAEEAAVNHYDGVLRLFALQLSEKIRWMHRNHGIGTAALAAWTPFGEARALIDDLAWHSLATVAGHAPVQLRTQADFEARLDHVRRHIGATFQKQARELEQALERAGKLDGVLDDAFAARYPEVHADARQQFEDLLYDRFLRDLEPGRLAHYPRYLEALELRLERHALDPRRDAELMRRIVAFWERYVAHLEAGGAYDEALDRYRWLIEEYRVSVFAQQLGTAEKVSPKRLEEAWKEVTGNG